MPFIVRRATKSDLAAMFRISVATHQANYREMIPEERRDDFHARYSMTRQNEAQYKAIFSKRLKDSTWHLWVADQSGEVIGYTIAKIEPAEPVHKRGLFVDPDHQGEGVGTALMRAAYDQFPGADFDLVVLEKNVRARRLYEKHGFVASGPGGTFYGAPRVLMTLRKN